MRTACGATVLVLAAVAAGCGGEERAPGTLTVGERWTEGPYFIEGHVAYAFLAEPGGREMARARSDPMEPGRPLLVRRLAPGRYRLTGYVRSCAPSCTPDGTDPPSNRCSAVVDVDGDTTVTFVRAHPDDCHVEIDQPPR